MHWFLATVVASLAASLAAGVSSDKEELTNLFIGFHPADHDNFERTLYNISDPHHKRYGHHLSGEEARALLQPAPGATENVKKWLLEEHDVRESSIEDRGGYIQARVPILKATSLSKRSHAGYDQVPDHIRRHVSHIQRMDTRTSGSKNKYTKRADQRRYNIPRHPTPDHLLVTRDDGFDPDPDLEVCKETLTPECVFKLYNVDPPPTDPDPKTLYGIPGFSDVSVFHFFLKLD